MTRFGRLPGEFTGIDQDIQDFAPGDEAMVSRVEFVIRTGGSAINGSIGVRQSPESHVDQARLELGGLDYPAGGPAFERDGFAAQAAQYYRRLIGVHGTQVRAGMSVAGVRMQHHYLSERVPFEVDLAAPGERACAPPRSHLVHERFGPRVCRPANLIVLEIAWRIREAGGAVLQCEIDRAGPDLDVRAGYPSRLVKSRRCRDVDVARTCAAEWRLAALAKRGFEELIAF